MNAYGRAPRAKNWLGALLIGIVLLGLGGFALAGVLLRAPPVDEDLCRTDQPLTTHTIILIDTSDRLERRHKRQLEAVAAQERARLGQFDRLTIMRLNARRPQEPPVLFSKCLPKPPEQTNPLFENPRLTQAHWDESFAEALDRALATAQGGGRQRASFILAGLRAIAAEPGFSAAIPKRRLVVVSDLLEHDPEGFSLYADGADYAGWRAAAPQGPPDFSDVEIRLTPLDRPEQAARQAASRDAFWAPYLAETNAKSVSIDPSF